MAKTKEFSLDENLEKIIQSTSISDNLLKLARENPSKENVDLRRNSAKFFRSDDLKMIDPALFLEDIETRREHAYELLQNSVTDDKVYKEISDGLRSSLDEQVTLNYYANLLMEGISPKKASDDLKKVQASVKVAETIRKALEKGDEKSINEAVEKVNRYIDPYGKKLLDIRSFYSGPAFTASRSKVLEDAMNAQYNMAMSLIKEKNLYAEIDQGVEDTKYGRATALIGMYNAYNQQQEKDKAKEEEKAKETKAKGK